MSRNVVNNQEKILETIATNTANIKVEAESVDLNLDSLEVKVDLTNSRLATIDSVLDNSLIQQTACATDLAANEVLLTAIDADTSNIATSTAACATDLAALEVLQTSTNSKLDHLSGDLDTLETTLTAIETDVAANEVILGNILTKNGEIDTAVDAMSAKLPASLGQKANASSMSVCRTSTAGAYDLSARTTIGTASTSTKLLCDAAGHLQVDIVSGGGSTDVSALSTHAKQDTIIGHIDGVETLLGTIDSDTDAIKTSTAACATDLAALEVLQTSTNSKLDHLSGNLDTLETTLTAIETDVAANEVLLTAIDADTSNIATSTAACATDLAALEVLQTSTNTKLDHLSDNLDTLETTLTAIETDIAANEVLLTAANGKHAANETLLGTIDSDTDAIKTSTAACATDLAAIEVLLTAANVDHDANETLLTQVSQKLGDIETAVQLIDNGYGDMTTTTLHSAAIGSSSSAVSSVFTKPREITHAGITCLADTNGTYTAFIEFSVDNTTYHQGSNLNFSNQTECQGSIGSSAISSGYKYYRVRIANNHSGSQTFTVKISY